SDGEVLNAGSVDLDGQGVAAGVGDAGDVKLELAEGAAHLIFTGDLFAVEPDTGAIVDAAEVEPQSLAGEGGRQGKFGAIPPGDGVGAVGGNIVVGEVGADLIGDARGLTQVHAVVGVEFKVVGDARGEDGGGNGGGHPALLGKAGGGQRGGRGRNPGRGLDGPAAVQLDLLRTQTEAGDARDCEKPERQPSAHGVTYRHPPAGRWAREWGGGAVRTAAGCGRSDRFRPVSAAGWRPAAAGRGSASVGLAS